MRDEDNQNELFTWVVKAGLNRLYYINIKQDKNNEIYLVIKESKREADGKKQVHRVMVFGKDMKKFVEGFKKSLEFVNSNNLLANYNEESPEQDKKPTVKAVSKVETAQEIKSVNDTFDSDTDDIFR